MPTYGPCNPLVTDIDPEVLAAQRALNAQMSGHPMPDVSTPEGLAQLRAMTANNHGETVLAPSDYHVGDTRVRAFVPEEPPRAVLLRIHGGGWAAGAPEDDDVVNDQFAREAGIAVLSPDYRLAPEHPALGQVEDCVAAVCWLAEHAAGEFGTDRLLIGGASSGAHVAACTLLVLRERHPDVLARVEAALLDCGLYDLAGNPSLFLSGQTPVLSTAFALGLRELAFPGLGDAELRDPRRSPAYNDLGGLPPALFVVGDLDPLRDDSVMLALRWRLAGNEAQLDVWPDAAHAFTCMGTPLGAVANARIVAWLSAIVERAPAQVAA